MAATIAMEPFFLNRKLILCLKKMGNFFELPGDFLVFRSEQRMTSPAV